MSWREIVEVCYVRYGRKPSHHSVKHITTSGLPPSLQARRYHPWHLIPDPAERRLAVIRLHSEGWSITSIAQYMQTSRHTIYDTLHIQNEIRKLQQNPLLGEYRVHTESKRESHLATLRR